MAVLAALAGFGLAEAALRFAYPTLPSLAGLVGPTTWQEGEAIQKCNARALKRVEPPEAAPRGRKLLVVGDSVALGFGVQRNARFGAILAGLLARSGQPWSEVNGAFAGGTACITLALSKAAMTETHADLAVVALFADDLMEAPRFWVNGHRVAFPDTVHMPALRWIIERSYAANTIWWGTETLLFNRAQSLSRDRETLKTFHDSLDQVREQGIASGTPVILTLLPPAGLPACAKGATEPEVCELGEELDRIAARLDEWWPGWVDLRTVLNDGDYRLDVEKADLRLDVHPNEAGHVRIANGLYPAASAAVAR